MTVLNLIEILQLNKGNNIFIPLPSGQYFKTHLFLMYLLRRLFLTKN